MPKVREILLGLAGLVVFGATAHADMMTAEHIDIGFRGTESVCTTSAVQSPEISDFPDYTGVMELKLSALDLALLPDKQFKQTSRTKPPQILTDQQSSLKLCLSALIGLGLCSSAHCLKKLHFGVIPEWYHHGGPYQIGHSLVVNPYTLHQTPIYCFLQQENKTDYPTQLSHSRDIVSLWRESQFTPDVIASRGPPVTC